MNDTHHLNDRSDTSLTLVRQIRAAPETVWSLLVSPEGLRQWIGPDAGPVTVAETDPRPGGAYRLRFRMLDGSEHEAGGRYSIVEPPHRLVMGWRWIGDADDRGPSEVEVLLRPVSGGTEMTFIHRNLADNATRDSHESGWTGALDKLVAVLDGGLG